MKNTLEKKNHTGGIIAAVLILALFVLLYLIDNVLPLNSFTLMLVPVLKKAAIYSLLCVSLNLLNGFTGLFSLGQAGFMLIGAYTYAALMIPAGQHDAVYQYFDGGAIKFSIAEWLSGAIGVNAGSFSEQ